MRAVWGCAVAALTFEKLTALARYRDATERQQSCAGATAPSFICASCRRSRLQAGRKKVCKGVYRCAECHHASEYGKAIKGAA